MNLIEIIKWSLIIILLTMLISWFLYYIYYKLKKPKKQEVKIINSIKNTQKIHHKKPQKKYTVFNKNNTQEL